MKTSKILALYSLVASLVILFLGYKILNQPEKSDSEAQTLNEKLVIIESLVRIFNEVDAKWLETYNTELAIQMLNEIPESLYIEFSSAIEAKKGVFTKWINAQNASNDGESQSFWLTKLQNTQKSLDSLKKKNLKVQDSLLTQITDLKEKIIVANSQQKSKNAIQVISFKGNKGVQIHYLGEVVDGKANGNGVGIWTSGSVYRGAWKNNLRHGQGTFEWADGEKYVGSYIDGKRQGMGTYYWPNGERYEGEWSDDRRFGKGKLFDPDGNIKFDGDWKDDKPLKK